MRQYSTAWCVRPHLTARNHLTPGRLPRHDRRFAQVNGRRTGPRGQKDHGATPSHLALDVAKASRRVASFKPSTGRPARPKPPISSHFAMRMRGLEPPPGFPDTDLNRARLPIPPHPRGTWDAKIRTGNPARCSPPAPRCRSEHGPFSRQFAASTGRLPAAIVQGTRTRPLMAETRVRSGSGTFSGSSLVAPSRS